MGCTYNYKGTMVSEKELSDIITAKVLSDTKLSKSTTPIKIQNIDNLSKLNELFAGKWSMELDMQGMTIDQKIDNIYNKMESISKPTYNEAGELFERKKVISIGGYIIDFSNTAKSQWKDLIRTELLSKQDVSGERVKNTVIDFFNNASMYAKDKKTLSSDEFNSYFDKSEQIFNYQDIERLTKVLNWDKTVRLTTLKGAIKDGIIKNMDTSIYGDYNPIVSIRSQFSDNGNEFIKIDLIELSRRSLLKQEDGTQQDNIIGRIVGSKNANKNGVTLSNSFMSRNNILLNLVSNLIARNNKNIIIEDSLIVQITPYAKTPEERIVPTEVDHVLSKEQQRNMLKFKDISNNLSNELRSHFMADNEENNQHNYVRFLINFYRNNGGVGENFEKQREYMIRDLSKYFKEEGQTIYDKQAMIKKISSRLAYLHKSESSLLNSPEAISEHKYLLDALKSLSLLDNFSYQLNSKKDIDTISSQLSIISAIPQEEMQNAQEVIIATSRKVVRDLKEFNKEFDKKVFDVYHKMYSKNMGAFVNENFSMYKNAYATIEDINGIRRNAGHILWTTDINQDPLFAKQAADKLRNGEITQEILDANKWVVNQITERFIDSLMHKRMITFGSLYNKDLGREMIRKDFENLLMTETTYNKGMLPIMPKPTSEYVYTGETGSAVKRQLDVVEKEDEFSEILSNIGNKSDNFIIDELGDTFLDQIAYRSTSADNMSFLGSKDFLSKIGLEVVTVNGEDKIRTIDADALKNNMFTNDLQKMMKTFKLMGIRKQYYENDALPLLNGMYFEMKLRQQLKGADNENIINAVKDYINSTVKNEKKHLKGNPKVEKIVTSIGKLSTARVMAMNLSIAQISAFTNFSNSILEAISSDISGHYQFGTKELLKASGLFFSDFGKISELASRFQVVNASEIESISHFFTGYKGNKQLLSQFMMSLPNWATDFYARCTVMTAQMIKDGTFDAYTFDKEGGLTYNMKDDKRFNGEEGKARQEFVQQDHIIKGIGVNNDGSLRDAYTNQEMVNLKWISDKYIVGAYDSTEKALIGLTVLGKQFTTFRTWMLAKAGVVYQKAEFQNMGGRLIMVKDADGRYIGKWERRQIEGFVNTWGRFVGGALKLSIKNPITWSTMNADEKQNIARGGMAVAMFGLVMMLAAALFDDDDDNPYDLIDSKTGKEKFIPGIRFYKNFKYSMSSLILVEDIWGFLKNPFVSFNIINNFIYTFTGEFDVKRIQKGIQFWNGTDVATELIRSLIVGTEAMSENTKKELSEKRKEREKESKEEKRKNKE